MNIVDRIKELQKKQHGKVSLNALEKELAIGKSTISSWENKQPSADKLQKVAEYFNVSVDYLLGRTDNPKPINEIFAAHIKNDADYSDLPPEALQELDNYREYLRTKYKKK